MKIIKTGILAFFLGVLTFSCQNGDKNSITGKWTIENITPDDNSDNQGVQLMGLILAMDRVDQLEFTSDGKYHVLNDKDSVLTTSDYSVSEGGGELIIKEDGKEETMKISSQSESELTLKSVDGVTLSLKRKE